MPTRRVSVKEQIKEAIQGECGAYHGSGSLGDGGDEDERDAEDGDDHHDEADAEDDGQLDLPIRVSV